MGSDPFGFLTDELRCSEPDREELRARLRGAVVDLGAGAGSKVDPSSTVGVGDLGAALAVSVDREFAPSPGRTRVRADLDGKALPFRDRAFDAAVCMHVLEHVGQPAVLVREIARVLAPGGWLLAAVPNGWSFSDNLYKVWKLVFLVANAEPIPHVQRFSKRSVRRMLDAAGLEPRYVARIGETFEWLARHRLLRAGLTTATSVLARVHEDTFSYGWMLACRKRP
jgi:SAM-dependent methyltransferase